MPDSNFFNDEVNEELDKKQSDYYKFEEGKNQFRIVSPFAWGYKYNFKNSAEGAAKNYPFYKTDSAEVEANRSKLQLTAGMVVFDYRTNELKALTVHQKNILNAIREYNDNPKYGEPTGYDLFVTKTGSGKNSKYPSTTADPKEEMSQAIKDALAKVTINLDNFYEGKSVIETIEE
jgi:hypothetical protein